MAVYAPLAPKVFSCNVIIFELFERALKDYITAEASVCLFFFNTCSMIYL